MLNIICFVAFISFIAGWLFSGHLHSKASEHLDALREELKSKEELLFSDKKELASKMAEYKNWEHRLTNKEKQLEHEMQQKYSAQFQEVKKNFKIAQHKRTTYIISVYVQKISELNSLLEHYQSQLDNIYSQKNYYEGKIHDIEMLSSSRETGYAYMASLLADYKLLDYDKSADYLETKTRPALVEAKRIRELKKQTKEYLIEKNILQYRLDELLSVFPELNNYIEISDIPVSDSPKQNRLPDDEWNALSDSQRNQIVLDNYINGSKTKWQIGRDYELYVGYQYNKQGYSVDYFGSNHGVNDLGRDLIISKDGKIGIVQCKYWSSTKMIHEKHISQLYGTVVSYIIENKCLPDSVHGIFITNITLSTTAKKFAEYLGIRYKENYAIGEFPRIKCNIGKDEYGFPTKIYHLPTDQQYDSVKICEKDECFAFTVAEAELKGFRRAYRWHVK